MGYVLKGTGASAPSSLPEENGKNSGTEPCRFEGDVVNPERSVVLSLVAERLAANRPGHPLRVGIDGVCGSGKTTFSLDLTKFVAATGRTAVLVDSDGFHHVRARRYRQGRESAEGYYDDAYDFDSLTDRVLLPLGPDGTGDYAIRVHDLASDATIDDETAQAPPDTIVLFAATFIQRDQLRDLWDEVIYVDVQEEVAIARGVARDRDALGVRPQLVQHTKRATWRPAGSTSMSKTRAGGHRFSSTTPTLTYL